MSSMIEVKNVRKLFINEEGEKNEVLKNVNFHVDKNEFVVIFGPGQYYCRIGGSYGRRSIKNGRNGVRAGPGSGGGFSGYPLIPMAYGNAKCGIQHESPRHG